MSLNPGVERTAQSELKTGENLLWVGQPDPKHLALQGLPLALFGLAFTAASLVFGFIGPGFYLPVIIFLLTGLVMMSSPWWMYREGSKTVYAVTDKRLLIITGGGSPSVQSFDDSRFGSIAKIEAVERSNGSGDIVFARKVNRYHDSDGSSRTKIEPIGFFGIPDVRSVEKLVRDVAPRNAR
jgi:hypothetical protein